MPSIRRAPAGALSLVIVTTGAVGLVGAVTAYRLALGDPDDERHRQTGVPSVAPAAATDTPTPAAPRTRWAPCEPPAELEDGVCVTEVVRTVVVPAPSSAAARPAAPAPASPQPTRAEGRSEDSGGHDDDHGDDHGDDRDNDRDDDRHESESEDHEQEDHEDEHDDEDHEDEHEDDD